MGILRGIWRSLLGSRSESVAAVPALDPNFLDTLVTLNYAYQGTPFVEGSVANDDLTTMDYAYKGTPFVREAFL